MKAKAEKIEEQRALSEDETLSTVKKNRAKAMLQILEKEDTQPIRTAKISQEAAVRKVDKATKKAKKTKEDAEAANVASAAAAEEAEKTKTEAEAAAVDADAAVEASDAALASANEMLDAAVAQCNGQDSESSGQEGSFWWMDRQFEDAKKCVRLVVFVACCHRQRRRVSSSALASLPTLSDVVSVVVRNRGVDASQGALHHRLRRSPLPPPPLLGIVR